MTSAAQTQADAVTADGGEGAEIAAPPPVAGEAVPPLAHVPFEQTVQESDADRGQSDG